MRRASRSLPEAWRLFGDAEVWVDASVWEDVVARIVSAIRDLETAAQPTQAPDTLHVSATAMLFTLDGAS